MSQSASPRPATLSNLAREIAAVALLATVLGRVLGPALKGAHQGFDLLIRCTDFAGAFATFLFALGGTVVLIRQLAALVQDLRLTHIERFGTCALCAIVESLLLPSTMQYLPAAGLVLAGAGITLGFLSAQTTLRVPRTRALGVVLITMSVAALLHVGAAWLFAYAGERALYGLAAAARGLSTGSLVLKALGVLTALVWLSTRSRGGLTWGSRIALVVACVLTYGAALGQRETAALWQVLANRSLERLHALPEPFGPLSLAYLIESFCPLLAVVAWFRRNELPSVSGALALALLGSGTPDVPLCALAVALASVSAIQAARDDKGMWAVLLASPRTQEPASR